MVKSIDTAAAMKVPGMEAIFTWEDVPQDARRYTQAGQTYPEASPYDRLLIDRHVRFAGDVVAIVAGKDDKCVDKALKADKGRLSRGAGAGAGLHTAKDNPILVHPRITGRACRRSAQIISATCARTMSAATATSTRCWHDCDIVIDHVYHTRACQQAMMETFRTYCSIDLLRPAAHRELHADRVPHAPHHRQRPAHPERA